MEQEVLKYALDNWRNLNQVLNQLREDQVKWCLDQECRTEKRWTFIERLHQRYNILRVARERKELEHEFA